MAGVTTKTIMMNPGDVNAFVSAASRCEFEIDISNSNRFLVDAKSIVGVLGLDFTRPLYVSYSGFDSEFEALLHKFACAC